MQNAFYVNMITLQGYETTSTGSNHAFTVFVGGAECNFDVELTWAVSQSSGKFNERNMAIFVDIIEWKASG